MHAPQQAGWDGLAAERGDVDARRGHGLSFAPDVAALIGVERGEVIVKMGKAWIGPFTLLIQPKRPATLAGVAGEGGIDIQEVAAQQSLLAAKGLDVSKQLIRQGLTILCGAEQKAIALHRTEGTHAQKFWVVPQTELPSQLGKRLVKDEFAVAVSLEIQGGHGHKGFIPPEPQMAGLPALAGHDAAAGLQGMQPVPGKKWQRLAVSRCGLPQ